MEAAFLSSQQACDRLGVRPATLYAYVSRGLIRSVPSRAAGTHERKKAGRRWYVAEDVERLAARSGARRGHAAVAAGSMHWGEPVLTSSLTEITPEGPSYAGTPATTLAEQGATLEEIAFRLWSAANGPPSSRPQFASPWGGFRAPAGQCRIAQRAAQRVGPTDPSLSAQLGLPHVTSTMGAASDRQRQPTPFRSLMAACIALAELHHGIEPNDLEATLSRARNLVFALAACVAPRAAQVRAARATSVAGALAAGLANGPAEVARPIIERALVVCADHELNPSAFAARVAASAGADLYASTIAALATLSGPLHGGACERVEHLFDEALTPSSTAGAARLIRERLARGEAIPGFGHPLYRQGDPRAAYLIDQARKLDRKSTAARAREGILRAMKEAGQDRPTLDFGLVALARAAELTRGAGTSLFAIGRSVGWIAHALEQRRAGHILRPRARYVPAR